MINLDTEDPLVFERFVLWLYTNNITDDKLLSGQRIAIDVWLFADRRDIPLLMNEMINVLHLNIADNWIVPTNRLHKVYQNTTEGSALRRMLTWSMSRTIGSELLEGEYAEEWPREALLDVLRLALADRSVTARALSNEQYKELKMCPTYHVHEEGASCTDTVKT